MAARVKLSACLDGLLKSEMERCIEEANLGTQNTLVAKRYLIDRWPQIEIAAEMGWHRSVISERMPGILQRVEAAAKKMGLA
jgi:hypothetical protein